MPPVAGSGLLAYLRLVLRLLTALLLALIAIPAGATASCHVPSPSAHAHQQQHAPAPVDRHQHGTDASLCVGCIPPGDWLPPHVAAVIALPITAPVAVEASMIRHRGSAPALPPPRTLA